MKRFCIFLLVVGLSMCAFAQYDDIYDGGTYKPKKETKEVENQEESQTEENIEEENYELTTVGLQEAVYNAVLLNKYCLNGKILTRDNKSLDVVTLAKQYLIGNSFCLL